MDILSRLSRQAQKQCEAKDSVPDSEAEQPKRVLSDSKEERCELREFHALPKSTSSPASTSRKRKRTSNNQTDTEVGAERELKRGKHQDAAGFGARRMAEAIPRAHRQAATSRLQASIDSPGHLPARDHQGTSSSSSSEPSAQRGSKRKRPAQVEPGTPPVVPSPKTPKRQKLSLAGRLKRSSTPNTTAENSLVAKSRTRRQIARTCLTTEDKGRLYSYATSEKLKSWTQAMEFCPGKPLLRRNPGNEEKEEKEQKQGEGKEPQSNPSKPLPSLGSFLDECIENSIQLAEEEILHERQSMIAISTHEALRLQSVAPPAQGDGLERLKECYRLLDTFDWTRSIQQQQFHDAIIEVVLPHIVGAEEYPALKARLLARYNRKEPPLAAMLLCPRRWGKSICVSMALAVLMYMCRDLKILVFSQNQAASAEFMSMVLGYFQQLPGADKRMLFSSNRRFTVTNYGDTNDNLQQKRSSRKMNRMIACPASVDGLRGVTADICVLEEAAVIPREVTEVVIAPLLSVNNTVIIALSTSQDSENYYTRWFRRSDPDANALFIRVEAKRLCDDCQAAGDATCVHLEHLVPHWLAGGAGVKRVKVLLGDNQEMLAQEVFNVLPGVENTVFGAKEVETFLTGPRHVVEDERGCFILTMIDVAGGGSSQHAIVSLLVSKRTDRKVVLGIDESKEMDIDKFSQQLRRYMQHFARHPVLQYRRHYVCVECNYGGPPLAQTIFNHCRDGLQTVQEYRPNITKSGAFTFQDTKIEGVGMLRRDLKEKRLVLSAPLASLHRAYSPKNYTLAHDQPVLAQISKQCQAFRQRTSANGKMSYDGKTNDRVRDDMLITLILAEKYYSDLSSQISQRAALQTF